MTHSDKPLMAHLLRRAGFGATFQELDRYCNQGYEASVEELLHPERQPAIDQCVEGHALFNAKLEIVGKSRFTNLPKREFSEMRISFEFFRNVISNNCYDIPYLKLTFCN